MRAEQDEEIHAASALILRAGVIASVSLMLLGLSLSFLREAPDVARMESARLSADYLAIAARAARGDGLALIELGVLLLVLTPILRVASSAWIFAARERDRLYTALTLAVLALTLASLLILN